MSSVDAVVFSAVAKVQRQLAGFYGDEIAVDYLTKPNRTAAEVDTWLENPDNHARLARVYNSVLGFNRMGQYGYGRLIGSGAALTVLAASTAAVQALSYNTEFRTAILSHDPALINALANSAARDYLLAQHPAELAGWLASTAAATLTTLLGDHMTAMQDVMANPVCAPILMGDPATKNQLINYPALIEAIAATNDGLDAVLNDAAAWQTIVESETLLGAWLESSRAVERLASQPSFLASLLLDEKTAITAFNTSTVELLLTRGLFEILASSADLLSLMVTTPAFLEVIRNRDALFEAIGENFSGFENADDVVKLQMLAFPACSRVAPEYSTWLQFLFSSYEVREAVWEVENLCLALAENENSRAWILDNISREDSHYRSIGVTSWSGVLAEKGLGLLTFTSTSQSNTRAAVRYLYPEMSDQSLQGEVVINHRLINVQVGAVYGTGYLVWVQMSEN